MSYLYICLTVFFTVYGTFIIKWQVIKAGEFPPTIFSKLLFLLNLVLNPWVLSSFAAAFLASLTWMIAMTKLPLGHAYPFVSLSFVLVVLLSGVFFDEVITPLKLVGISFIILGIAIGSRG